MEKIGYIYAVSRKAMEKGIPVEDALEMIRRCLEQESPDGVIEKTCEST